jgi:circadian clock protein KaiB
MVTDGDGTNLEHPAPEASAVRYVLHLYVTGMTSRSVRAVENVRSLCKKHLAGRYELRIVDLYQQPDLARKEQVVAAPTLIKRHPLPLRRLVGDMSNDRRVLGGLDLISASGQPADSANA